ncbi:MAG: efflux RND transporter periplasmic adaptor subunit [Alphaproteobacteria bacterium]
MRTLSARTIVLGLVVVGVLAVIGWLLVPSPVAVDVATVSKGLFRQTVEEDGKTRVRDRFTISAPLAGALQRIRLRVGDAVAAGDTVAVILPGPPALIDARTLATLRERVGAAEAERDAANVGIKRTQASLDKAKADLDRAQALMRSGTITKVALETAELEHRLRQRDVDLAQASLHAAEHQLAVAKAALARAMRPDSGEELEPWQVKSPAAGRVLRVVQESEATVAIGAALLEIGDPRALEIVAEVLSSEAVPIAAGAPVELTGWGGAVLLGQVRLVEPGAFTKVSALGIEEQRVRVVIDIASPPEQWQALGDGYRVDAAIEVYRRPDALKLPIGAVFRLAGQDAVYVIEDGRARLRRIATGRRSSSEIEITGGLSPGQQVIAYPSERIADGVRVRAQPGR